MRTSVKLKKKISYFLLATIVMLQPILAGVLPVQAQEAERVVIGEYVKIDLASLTIMTPTLSGGETAQIAVNIASQYPITSARLQYAYESSQSEYSLSTPLYYDEATQTYQAEIEIGLYASDDTIQITGIIAEDQFNNRTTILHHAYDIYESADLRTDFVNQTIQISNENADVTAPLIDVASLTVTPKLVSAGTNFTVSLAVQEYQSGIAGLELMYDEVDKPIRISLYDENGDGIYEGTGFVDVFDKNGVKHLETISARDYAGNESFLFSEYYFTSNPHSTDLSQGDIEIIDGYEPEVPSDVEPPLIDLSTLEIEKRIMDGADQNLITIQASDDSQLPLTGTILFSSQSLNYTNTYANFSYNPELERYEAVIETSRYEPSRKIQVTQLQMSDSEGNTAYYYHPGYHPQEQPKSEPVIEYHSYDFSSETIQIENEFEDVTAPILNVKMLHAKQKKVDGRDAIVITARANDDVSGIQTINVSYQNAQATFFTDVTLIHKEAPDKYEGIIFIDETAVGNHKMEASAVYLTDYAGNNRRYSDIPEFPPGPKTAKEEGEYIDLSTLDFQYDENKIFYQPKINGIESVTLMQGSEFDAREGISAYDFEDGDLTTSIEIEGFVDTSTLGTYSLTYSVTDSDSQTIHEIREITVVAPTVPGFGPEGEVTPGVNAEADQGFGPEGEVTPGVDAEADQGFGSDGDVTPRVDAEADQGFGPEGEVTPGVDAEADQGFGPDGDVTPGVDAEADQGFGPEGEVTPGVDAEADQEFGPEGDVTPGVDAEADQGFGPEGEVTPGVDAEADQGFGPEGEVTPGVDAEVDQEDQSNSDTQPQLPETGEIAQTSLIFGGLAIATAGALIIKRKRV